MAELISDQLKQDLHAWLQHLGIDKDLDKNENFITAFTHPSYKGMFPKAEDYERYEFLGDSVLDLISAEELFFEQNFSEGVMTEKRKLVVNNDYLAQVFDRLKMAQFTRTAISYVHSTKDKANHVEAFIGALFIEYDYEKCKAVWKIVQQKMEANQKQTIQKPLTAEDQQLKSALKVYCTQLGLVPKNAKSVLQEFCQKRNLPIPEYILMDQSGPDHDPVFKVKVSIVIQTDPKSVGSAIGVGKRKNVAELKAAEQLCKIIFLDYIPSA